MRWSDPSKPEAHLRKFGAESVLLGGSGAFRSRICVFRPTSNHISFTKFNED